jgi:hypothetical protein
VPAVIGESMVVVESALLKALAVGLYNLAVATPEAVLAKEGQRVVEDGGMD